MKGEVSNYFGETFIFWRKLSGFQEKASGKEKKIQSYIRLIFSLDNSGMPVVYF